LRVVFENAAGEIDIWSQGAPSQLEQPLRKPHPVPEQQAVA